MHNKKIERDRRYGTVYTVVEHANAYLVGIEMPRRIPNSSLKELWKLPDEMPDYDYTVTLHERVLSVRAGVRGDAMRRLSYISASFPSDFLTRVEFEQPVASFDRFASATRCSMGGLKGHRLRERRRGHLGQASFGGMPCEPTRWRGGR